MPEDSYWHSSRRNVLRGIGAAGVAGVAGCLGSSGGGSGTTYKFGVVQSFSGDLSAYGDRWKRAQGIAEDVLAETDLPNGNEIEFLQEDTASSPETGVNAAQKLVNQENVDVLIGAVSSGVSIAIAESVTIPKRDSVFHIISTSSSPKITDLDYVVRSVPSDAYQAKALANLAQASDVQKASVITVNNDYGLALGDAFKEAFSAVGGSVTSIVPYESGKSTYKPQLNTAMEGAPDAILFLSYPQSFQTQAKQAYEMGIKDKVLYIGGESTFADPVINNVPSEAIDGMIGSVQQPPAGSEGWKAFSKRSKEKYDREADIFAAFDVDAIMFAALAIEAADSADANELRKQVRPVSRPPGTKINFTQLDKAKEELDAGNDIDYVGAGGSADIDDDGDVPGIYKWWKIGGGEYQMQDYIDIE